MAEPAVCLWKRPHGCLAVAATTMLLLAGPAASQSNDGMAADTLPDTLTYTDPPRPWEVTEVPQLRPRWMQNRAFDAYSQALADHQPTIILFSARPCGFCKTMLDRFSCPALVRYAGSIEFAVAFRGEDEGGDHLAAALNVQRYPTTVMLETDMDRLHVIGRIEGVFPADDIDGVIQEGYKEMSGDMEMPDLPSAEETASLLDEAGMPRPSEAFCAGEEP